MKVKSLLVSILCLLALSSSFISCSDEYVPGWDEGSKVELPQLRAFILNAGTSNQNNSSLTFYDPAGKIDMIGDIFYTQNGKKLGELAQDIIEYNDNLYITMYGSNYIVKMNGAGVEQCRYSFTEEQGQPRFMVAEEGKIYVTLYSGNVARLDAATLKFEKMVKVGKNPECIIEENGKLYCVNSGWGTDNRLSIIDLHSFNQAEQVEIFQNPEKIIECNDRIFIQGYGGNDYLNYPYPVVEFNPVTKQYKEIGKGTHIAAQGNILYVIHSNTNWSTYETVNTFYSYNAANEQVNNVSFLKNMPAELASASVSLFVIDSATGDMYIGVTHYSSGNGDVYRFKSDGTFVEKFVSGGQSPYKIVFAD